MNPRLILGHGREDAEIMIVTDYASKEESATGRAGAGYVGRKIGYHLKDNGWSLDRCYITNYIKREFHLPRAKNLQNAAYKEAMEFDITNTYEKILGKEIADIKPNVIVA